MTERWKIDDCTIIGAQGSLTGNAPFWRCPPLVLNENFPGRVGVVLMYAGDSVDVSVVPEQVYQEALEKNTWCKLSESELFRYADVWMLRANFPFTDFAIDDIESAKVGANLPREDQGTTWMLVRRDTDAEQLLKEWCDRGAAEAIMMCATEQYDLAYNCACLAFGLCQAPEKSGLYLAVLEVTQREALYRSAVHMIEQSYGQEFALAVQHCKARSLAEIYKNRCDILSKDKE